MELLSACKSWGEGNKAAAEKYPPLHRVCTSASQCRENATDRGPRQGPQIQKMTANRAGPIALFHEAVSGNVSAGARCYFARRHALRSTLGSSTAINRLSPNFDTILPSSRAAVESRTSSTWRGR